MAYQLDLIKAAAEANQSRLKFPMSTNLCKTMNHNNGVMYNFITSFDRRFMNEACNKAAIFVCIYTPVILKKIIWRFFVVNRKKT